ncbi:MAG: hypothetical protein ACTHMC_01490 [Pseudobacter sp.]|uniref:hypothetical protein n=1 Tax=Pseudobacter sp. TaxID=2045420 RepID=UPI003F81F152
MGYLYPADYNKAIQDVSLQQIISGDRSLLASGELFAQGLMVSHLRQKYDTAQEFTNTNAYNPSSPYGANDRVYLDAPAYSATASYNVGELCLQGGKVFQCTVAISVGELFNPGHWLLLGAQYTLFYALCPDPVFNLQGVYSTGNKVFWKNRIYTCINATWFYDHQSMLQFGATYNVPPQNYFPDDPINGSKQWQDNGAYIVPPGSLLSTDPVYFLAGDNRNQQMVAYMLDVMIYRIYTRIAPKNIPEDRESNYKIALMWLRDCAKGDDITADLVKKQPLQGRRIRGGSDIKRQNSY